MIARRGTFRSESWTCGCYILRLRERRGSSRSIESTACDGTDCEQTKGRKP